MTTERLTALRSLDSAVLTQVVQSQQNPGFEVLNWTVTSLSNKRIANPDGLFLFSGQGRNDQTPVPWSMVLKILKAPDKDIAATNMWYWKREFLAYKSGLLNRLPGPVVVPRCYALTDHSNEAWIWMEHIRDASSARWTLDDYVFAAHELGRLNGNSLLQPTQPSFSWLSKDYARTWWRMWFPTGVNALTAALENDVVKQAFSPELQMRAMQHWHNSEKLLSVLDRLPQVFSHYDYTRRNLFIRQPSDGQKEVVALDWAWCGYGALGGDLYSLLGASAALMEIQMDELRVLDTWAYEAYLTGLQETGWSGNPDLVRLAYAAWVSLWVGAPVLPIVAMVTTVEMRPWFESQFDCTIEAGVTHNVQLCEFGLDRASEAQQLMHKLGLD